MNYFNRPDALQLMLGCPEVNDENFLDYIRTEPGRTVCRKFILRALRLKRQGAKGIGAKAIFEDMRRYERIKGRDPAGLKLNNSWTSRMSRYAELAQPELEGYFEKREMKTTEKKD